MDVFYSKKENHINSQTDLKIFNTQDVDMRLPLRPNENIVNKKI